jgi:hypothetical protein
MGSASIPSASAGEVSATCVRTPARPLAAVGSMLVSDLRTHASQSPGCRRRPHAGAAHGGRQEHVHLRLSARLWNILVQSYRCAMSNLDEVVNYYYEIN